MLTCGSSTLLWRALACHKVRGFGSPVASDTIEVMHGRPVAPPGEFTTASRSAPHRAPYVGSSRPVYGHRVWSSSAPSGRRRSAVSSALSPVLSRGSGGRLRGQGVAGLWTPVAAAVRGIWPRVCRWVGGLQKSPPPWYARVQPGDAVRADVLPGYVIALCSLLACAGAGWRPRPRPLF